MSESVDELSLDDIIKFLWSIRGYIIKVLIVILLLVGGNFVLSHFRNQEAERGPFSSANLDRVERGVYRVRVEIFGDRLDPRREDALVDFDRELNVTIQKEDDVLSLRVENLKEDIIIHNIRLQGRLRNRSYDDFYLVDTTHHRLGLRFDQKSRGVPLVAYTTDIHHNQEINNWLLLRDIDEFRQYFELEFLEISFYFSEGDFSSDRDERLVLRYIARSDLYELFGEPVEEELVNGVNGEESEDEEPEDEEPEDEEPEDEEDEEEDEESEDEEPDDEESDDDESEDDESDGNTRIVLVDHAYEDFTQTFTVATSQEEIILRIEHSDDNWIDTPFYNVFSNVFEETLAVDANGVAELFVGAIHNMDAMFINDVEVDFASIGLVGYQHFIFHVLFE